MELVSSPNIIIVTNISKQTSVRKNVILGLNCPLEYLQAYMTDLVSLLFIAMIPIDCKITNFPCTCIIGDLIG